MEIQNDQDQPLMAEQNPPRTFSKSPQQEYQEALLKSGIQAANLLSELLELKIMPDPRAKEMADVALELIRLINSAPPTSHPAEDSESSDVQSSAIQSLLEPEGEQK